MPDTALPTIAPLDPLLPKAQALLAQSDDDSSAPLKSLLPYLRYQLKVIRDHLMSGAPQKSDFKDLQSLYAATGDTQRLPMMRAPA